MALSVQKRGYDGLMSLGFDVISVKQMTTNHRSSAEGTTTVILPLFLITLPRTTKLQYIFTLSSICHIAIKVEPYEAQNALTQYYLGHVCANCKQPPRCMCCAGNHLHKDCPETENTSSTLTCCNCQLAEEIAQPSNCRGFRHAKEEMQNTQGYDWKDVFFNIYHPSPVLRSGSSRPLGTKEATTSTIGFSSRSDQH
jgi:hypothetical protein